MLQKLGGPESDEVELRAKPEKERGEGSGEWAR